MAEDSCRLPARGEEEDVGPLRRMLNARRIAVVGLSDDPSRPSFAIASYLLSAGKEVIPVNPNHTSVLGQKCYPSLESVPGPIDVVNVFRRPEFCGEVARSAAKVGAKGLWLQSGITSDEAREIAGRAGIDFVENRCIMVEMMHNGRD